MRVGIFVPTSFQSSQNAVFSAIDKDKRGTITAQEMKSWMKETNPSVAESAAATFIKDFDGNDDGALERSEFPSQTTLKSRDDIDLRKLLLLTGPEFQGEFDAIKQRVTALTQMQTRLGLAAAKLQFPVYVMSFFD